MDLLQKNDLTWKEFFSIFFLTTITKDMNNINLNFRINGKPAGVNSKINFPVSTDQIGTLLAQLLIHCYEEDYFIMARNGESWFEWSGTAEGEVSGPEEAGGAPIIYKFSYSSESDPERSGLRHFHAHLDGDESNIWHASTNIDERG
jgi:hypothetical protein